MTKITIEGIEYVIPTDIEEIKLESYETWFDATVETFDDKVRLVSRITTIPYEVLINCPISFFHFLMEVLNFLFEKNIDSYEAKNEIIVDKVKYHINFIDELTLGEYADVESVYEQEEYRLSELLAIICRPIGEKYDSKKNPERIEMFKKLSIDKVLPLFSFFLQRNENWLQLIIRFSQAVEQVDQYQTNIKSLAEDGDGKGSFTRLQKKTYQKLIRQQNSQLSQF